MSQAARPAIGPGASRVASPSDPAVVYQTLLAADALRYLTLQVTGAKGSGHPGGFASSAEAHAALMMLGHTHIVTEVGHHAPGFYSAMFLDRSLEEMGIHTVAEMMQRFRERHGLLGHLSGAIPGLLAPAGPLGQGQHFAMAGALLHPGTLFPVTIGDGGMGEPYVLNAMMHFHTAYPQVTNFLAVLIWNGYSQEHHSMVSRLSNDEMVAYWRGHGFAEVVLVDAKAFDDSGQEGAYVDSTHFSLDRRLDFTRAVIEGLDRAARSALGGRLTAFVVKQLKGSGVHTVGAKSHNLYPKDTLDQPHIVEGLQRRALPPEAWDIVRANLERAGGGPAARTVVTERVLEIAPLGALAMEEHARGASAVPSTAMGALVAQVGRADPRFVVTNADGNEASAMKNINDALKIRHPTADEVYNQAPGGQVYEPLNEDACAGLAAGLALFGSRALWLSYESFAINGWPIVQTVAQAMAELRRRTPSIVCMFTAGALEQGRNGWTHQRPEIESYFAAMMRNGNVYPLFPCDLRPRDPQPQQGDGDRRLEEPAAGPPEPRGQPPRDRGRRGRRLRERSGRPRHGGVCRHRRHGAAPGVRGEGPARGGGLARAHRRRGQPAAALPAHRRRLGHGGRARQPLPGRRPLPRAVRRRRAARRERRAERAARAGAAAHAGAAPRRVRLEARRDHRLAAGAHGVQRHHRRGDGGAGEGVGVIGRSVAAGPRGAWGKRGSTT